MQINKIIAHTESTTLKLKTQQTENKNPNKNRRKDEMKSKYGSPLQLCHRVSNIYIYYIVDDAIYLQCKMSQNQTKKKMKKQIVNSYAIKIITIRSVRIARTQHKIDSFSLSIFNSIVTSFTNFIVFGPKLETQTHLKRAELFNI